MFRLKSNSEDTTWSKLISFSNLQEFIDTTAELNVNYQYKVRAIDSVGNKSDFSPIKSITRSIDKSIIKVSNLILFHNNKTNVVDLKWDFKLPKNLDHIKYSYIIYRSCGMDGVKYYKELNSENPDFKDLDLKSGLVYNYAIQIKSTDGWTGAISETKSILIK